MQAREIFLADTSHDDDGAEAGVLQDLRDDDSFDPSAELERHDMAVLLDRAMGLLPASTRDIVELCYLAELPQAEVAARLGMTISSLEARLHRARKQLRQVLNGELRAEAESFGLALDPAAMGQWRESRDWCLICGKSRLWGIFEPMPDGRIDFRMRCPSCLIGEIFCSGGLVNFKGSHSFRPAMKRLATAFGAFYGEALLHDGRTHCWNCHQPVHLDVTQIGMDYLPIYTTWMEWRCRCGQSYSAGIVACLNEPAVAAFLANSIRCIIEPDILVTFQGAPAVRFSLHDLANGRRMLIFAHPQTLAVLATVIE